MAAAAVDVDGTMVVDGAGALSLAGNPAVDLPFPLSFLGGFLVLDLPLAFDFWTASSA